MHKLGMTIFVDLETKHQIKDMLPTQWLDSSYFYMEYIIEIDCGDNFRNLLTDSLK